MRGTVSKRIRRKIYMDASIRSPRRYSVSFVDKIKKVFVGKEEKGADEEGYKEVAFRKGTIFNTGLRGLYQKAKKEYKRGMSLGVRLF